jgi:hypothetical protein
MMRVFSSPPAVLISVPSGITTLPAADSTSTLMEGCGTAASCCAIGPCVGRVVEPNRNVNRTDTPISKQAATVAIRRKSSSHFRRVSACPSSGILRLRSSQPSSMTSCRSAGSVRTPPQVGFQQQPVLAGQTWLIRNIQIQQALGKITRDFILSRCRHLTASQCKNPL